MTYSGSYSKECPFVVVFLNDSLFLNSGLCVNAYCLIIVYNMMQPQLLNYAFKFVPLELSEVP